MGAALELDRVHGWAAELAALCERIGPRFGRIEVRRRGDTTRNRYSSRPISGRSGAPKISHAQPTSNGFECSSTIRATRCGRRPPGGQ